VGLGLGVLLAAIGGFGGGGAEVAAPCRPDPDRECLSVVVPLDRSGAVPGTVRLRGEVIRARHPSTRPPLLVLAGLPGWGSRQLAYDGPMSLARTEGHTRDVIKIDLRGTGRSGALTCAAMKRVTARRIAGAAARCARELGPRRGLYTVQDSVADVEAVRQVVGADHLALLGGSYGAQVAFAYAQRHPARVERLVLDSIPGPTGFDALYRPGLAAIPDAVQVLCRKRRCQHASGDPQGEVIRLARRLARGPLPGVVYGDDGRPRREGLRPFDLVGMLFAALAGDRSVLGQIHNANRGDLKPLLRRRWTARTAPATTIPADLFSYAAYAASMCEESLLPWSPTTPISGRPRQSMALVSGQPPGAFGALGVRGALGSDVLELCRLWPMTGRPAAPPPQPLPAIPTLVAVSVEDMLAPVSSARAVAALIPGARLLRLRGAGHSPVSSGLSSCADAAVGEFLARGATDEVCGPEHKSYRGAMRPPPLSLAELPPDRRVRGRAGRTLTAVNATVRDGRQILDEMLMRSFLELRARSRRDILAVLRRGKRVGGLRGGTYRMNATDGRLVLDGASYVPGVRLTGSVTFARERRGVIRVHGPAAARGTLVIRGGVVTGQLGGRDVRAPTRWGPAPAPPRWGSAPGFG
jgi:pimeloyl-ACP methyl ester carboxylesterase